MSFSLVIDTAFETCQIALLRNDAIVAQERTSSGGQHDRVLASMTERLFATQKIDLKNIGTIIVTTGPGRFTGLRVGIAFARGLALVHQTPLVGVLTTDALAWQAEQAYPQEPKKIILVAVKRGESFVTGSNPRGDAIRSVKDEDIVSYIKEQGDVLVCGVLSPVAAKLLLEDGIRVAADITEPSLEAIAAIGGKAAPSAVVRPYYAESYVA